MSVDRFPHLVAVIEGRLSMMSVAEWPAVRDELRAFATDFYKLKGFTVELVAESKQWDRDTAREFIDANVIPPPKT